MLNALSHSSNGGSIKIHWSIRACLILIQLFKTTDQYYLAMIVLKDQLLIFANDKDTDKLV